MVAITVKLDTNKARSQIKGIRDQVPFATRLTLNQLGRTTKKELDKEVKQKIDRPTRFTQRAIIATKSTSKTMTSTVKVKDKVRADGRSEAKILGHLFGDFGGNRDVKAFERLLRSRGILPSGKFIIPSPLTPLDSFGNIRRAHLRKIINGLQGVNINGTNISTLAPGIWLRKIDKAQKRRRKKKGLSTTEELFVVHKQVDAQSTGKRGQKQRPPEPQLLFSDRPRYRRLFNMKTVAVRVVSRDLGKAFEKNYEFALKTAKKV